MHIVHSCKVLKRVSSKQSNVMFIAAVTTTIMLIATPFYLCNDLPTHPCIHPPLKSSFMSLHMCTILWIAFLHLSHLVLSHTCFHTDITNSIWNKLYTFDIVKFCHFFCFWQGETFFLSFYNLYDIWSGTWKSLRREVSSFVSSPEAKTSLRDLTCLLAGPKMDSLSRLLGFNL